MLRGVAVVTVEEEEAATTPNTHANASRLFLAQPHLGTVRKPQPSPYSGPVVGAPTATHQQELQPGRPIGGALCAR